MGGREATGSMVWHRNPKGLALRCTCGPALLGHATQVPPTCYVVLLLYSDTDPCIGASRDPTGRPPMPRRSGHRWGRGGLRALRHMKREAVAARGWLGSRPERSKRAPPHP